MSDLIEHRCKNKSCNKLLCKSTSGTAIVEIKCKCGLFNTIKCSIETTKRYDEKRNKIVDQIKFT